MRYALATVSSGLIDNISFFNDTLKAVKALANFVKGMNVEKNDAALYGPDGLLATVKNFLDEHDEYAGDDQNIIDSISDSEDSGSIYLIGNPEHRLGFIVATSDDPLGYNEPAEAVSELAQMRMDHGRHLKPYRGMPETEPVTSLPVIEPPNAASGLEHLHPTQVADDMHPTKALNTP